MLKKNMKNILCSRDRIAVIVLSAGYSSRMSDFKPLLRFGDKTALEHIIDTFHKADIIDIIVVTGHNREKIQNSCKGLKVDFVYNSNYPGGMYTSVVEGVKNLDERIGGFFILPVDIPLVKDRTIIEIKKAFKQSEKGIIHPVFNGKRGHPPLISSCYKGKIVNNKGAGGLKRLLEDHNMDSLDIQVVDQAILLDMDTKEEYMKLLEYHKNSKIPNLDECRVILNKYCVLENVIKHCEKVREVAMKIAEALINKGFRLNLPLIGAAALLHDIERDKPEHAIKGWKLLNELGYHDVADIVKEHMDIIPEQNNITEKEIVYLSDKMVIGNKVVSIDERFKKPLNKFKENKKVIKIIKDRKTNAKIIANKINKSGIDIYENKWIKKFRC